jgi:hypothetical protein
VIGVIPEGCEYGKGISSRAVAAASVAIDHIVRLLSARGFDCQRRSQSLQPRVWWFNN